MGTRFAVVSIVAGGLVGVLAGALPARAQGFLMGLDPTMPPVFVAAPYAGPMFLVPEPRLVPRPIVRPFFTGAPAYATYYPAPIVHPYQQPRIWVVTIRVPRREPLREPEPPPPEPESEPRTRGPKVVWFGSRR